LRESWSCVYEVVESVRRHSAEFWTLSSKIVRA